MLNCKRLEVRQDETRLTILEYYLSGRLSLMLCEQMSGWRYFWTKEGIAISILTSSMNIKRSGCPSWPATLINGK